MEQIQLLIIIIGIVIILISVLWNIIPFGRMPGDIAIDRGNFKFYFPVVTSIIISIVLAVVLWIIMHFRG
ncbi:MAG: DUF2905 domain-containing protein [Nanoarchaeota archaeon]|nr:DUF2905 domain-containing protein [Nanoarchaeota archaeon]MBU1135341.1 DUF2905 domain-containing protein [Nanoarchaeota archaeon]MBU2519705.1 DUF2905 domain-containing protein [Nanoarchaeota archaeon]